jgi:hypothetical protein
MAMVGKVSKGNTLQNIYYTKPCLLLERGFLFVKLFL